MLENAREPRAVIVSVRIYQRLAAAYPADFHRDYGAQMAQLFRDCCRRAYLDGGIPALLALWARTALDYLKTMIVEYARGGVYMTREKFIKLSGWALILGGVALTLGWLPSILPEYGRFSLLSARIDLYLNTIEVPLFFMGTGLLSIGFIGLLLRYGQDVGSFGRFSLGLGALSGFVSSVGAVGSGIYESEHWWPVWFLGIVVQFLGLALFGIVNLRRPTLPRWNGLPLLAGAWIPLYVLVGLGIERITNQGFEPSAALSLSILLLTLAGVTGLGYLMQTDSAGLTAANA
jgi:hypothetical protein